MSDALASRVQGLRARKRARTEAEIVANAIRLFREAGVRAASLRDVARASDVSQATLFNYFPNKGALAEAWVRGEVEAAVSGAVRERGGHGLRSTMRGACRQLAAQAFAERALRLEAWRETGRAPRQALASRHPIVLAIRAEQEGERVRADLSARALGAILLDAIEGGLIEGLGQASGQGEAGGQAMLAKAIQARVDLVLDGARKRNERVLAPGSGSGPSTRRRVRTPRESPLGESGPTSGARNT